MNKSDIKLQQWKNKLLDLSAKNSLLNIKRTTSILLANTFEEVLHIIATGMNLSIYPHADGPPPSSGEGHLRSILSEGELNKKEKKLLRSYKSSLAEAAVHNLYLALGLLSWNKAAAEYQAPLVLIPCEICRIGRNRYAFTFAALDEANVNKTLFQYLQQAHGIVIPPAALSSSDDILAFIDSVKEAVSCINWSVSEKAAIGSFSFSNIALWSELDRRGESIVKHKLINAIINGLGWKEDSEDPEEGVDLFFPLPADASQKVAIEKACNGRPCIVKGPPGTGKSNAIVNIIANTIARGKNVLLLSEKASALSVVQDRLAGLGLSPFCLNLSSKATTKQVLSAFGEALNLPLKLNKSDIRYNEAAAAYADMCNEADRLINALRRKQSDGLSLMEMLDEYEKYRHAPDIHLAPISASYLDKQTKAIENLMKTGCISLNSFINPHSLWNTDCRLCEKLRAIVPAYENALTSFKEILDEFCSLCSLDEPSDWQEIINTMLLARSVMFVEKLPEEWKRNIDRNEYFQGVCETCLNYIVANKIKCDLLNRWESSFFELDAEYLLPRFSATMKSPLVWKWVDLHKLAQDLRPHAKGKVNHSTLSEDIKLLKKYHQHITIADSLKDIYLITISDDMSYEEVSETAGAVKVHAELLGKDILHIITPQSEIGRKLTDAFRKLMTQKQYLNNILDITDQQSDNYGWFEHQADLCALLHDPEAFIRHIDAIKDAYTVNLAPLADAYIEGSLKTAELLDAYHKQRCKQRIDAVLNDHPYLKHHSLEEMLDTISSTSKGLNSLAAQCVYTCCAKNIASSLSQPTSELTLLKKALTKPRGLSIRELLGKIPSLSKLLCPCVIASPAAVANLPDNYEFDLVIIDEASQLPTYKAAAALARGKSFVICGDEKQLPPSNFFTRMDDGEDIPLEDADMSNILEDCLVLSPAEYNLNWHYRSCSELIAYSNRSFYNGSLISVPAASTVPAVSMVKVNNGIYANQRNFSEAEAVLNEIISRFEKGDSVSIGIITMNVQQQKLIQDMLDEARDCDGHFDEWLENLPEPVFVRNLENIQGAERDLTLLCGNYAPDENGFISHTMFGPLNREGSWRRLNVAVTRARKELVIFSSLMPEDITTPCSRGVAAYKGFLSFAANGTLPCIDDAASEFNLSRIKDIICERLTDMGYHVTRNVGDSFRVDIAVKAAGADEYALGILLDSPMNAEGMSSIKAMLHHNGWRNIHLFNPITWYLNPDAEMAHMLKSLSNHSQ